MTVRCNIFCETASYFATIYLQSDVLIITFDWVVTFQKMKKITYLAPLVNSSCNEHRKSKKRFLATINLLISCILKSGGRRQLCDCRWCGESNCQSHFWFAELFCEWNIILNAKLSESGWSHDQNGRKWNAK